MSAHLLETSDEDSFLLVARFVGDLLNEGQERTALADTTGSRFIAECEALLGEARYGDYLDKLLGQLDDVFAKAQDKDLECVLSICCHLALRASPAAVDKLAAKLTAKTDSQVDARLAGLATLYNVATAPAAQYSLLLKVLQYALATGQADNLAPGLKADLDAVLIEWQQLTDAQKRDLLVAAAAIYRASKTSSTSRHEAFGLMMRALDLLEGASAQEVAALKPDVLSTVLMFIGAPDLFIFGAWDSLAVQQLAKDKEGAPAFGLLKVLVTGDVKEFEAYAKSNAALFGQAGTTQEAVLDKMRVLTIAALALGKQEVAFGDIQAALGIPAAEVERWVVRTVGKGLMEGKIDQLRGVVTVTQCCGRTFGKQQWVEVRDRLAGWRTRLSGMQEVVASQKAAFPKGMPPVIRAA